MEYKKELAELIDIVIAEDASDLHLSAGRHPTVRVAGSLVPLVKKKELTKEDTFGFMETLLSDGERKEFLLKKELDFSYSYKDVARFRCNTFVAGGSVGIAMRFIPRKIRTLKELGLPQALSQFAKLQQGFFLVVGPVGHGKSTTLASLLDVINHERTEHIITIEDPIEYTFVQDKSIIDQREVKHDTNDFQTALVSVFRQDVDVLMVGEMRGPETMETAVTAAETGHLVFSTLHTNSVSQTIDRIIDSFPGEQQNQIRIQLAASLTGIFSQRLIPRVSGGVVPAYELLINNDAVANLIREARTHEIESVVETSLESGMVDMNRSLAELVGEGSISLETAQQYSLRPQLLHKFLS